MPAVTTRFVSTKQDMRNGKKTGSPVSVRPVSTRGRVQGVPRAVLVTWVEG